MKRALFGISILSLSAGPLGAFLILQRMSLAGDAIAHAILPGVAMGYVLFGFSTIVMIAGGVFAGMSVALLSTFVTRNLPVSPDAALATFYLIALALGVVMISLHGSNIDLLHALFGTALGMNQTTLLFIAGVASATLLILAVIYRPLVIDCLDPRLLKLEQKSHAYLGEGVQMLFLFCVVLNLVAGFHSLGTLLAIGMMVIPGMSARFWSPYLGGILVISAVTGVIMGVLGLLVSYHYGLPAGPSVILVGGIHCLFSFVFGREGGFIWPLLPQKHRER